jgi:transposase
MRTVCCLNIHKDSIFMCILDSQGKKSEEKFRVSKREIKRLSLKFKDYYVTEVFMESTSIYWIPIWRLLDNNFHLKNIRKDL